MSTGELHKLPFERIAEAITALEVRCEVRLCHGRESGHPVNTGAATTRATAVVGGWDGSTCMWGPGAWQCAVGGAGVSKRVPESARAGDLLGWVERDDGGGGGYEDGGGDAPHGRDKESTASQAGFGKLPAIVVGNNGAGEVADIVADLVM